MSKCIRCGDTGRTKENPFKCNHCGKEYEKGPLIEVNNFGIYIPKEYENEMWDKNIAEQGISPLYKLTPQKEQVTKWVQILDNILTSVKNKNPMVGAFFVSAPKGRTKTRWQYTLQITANNKGYNIFPITDVIDLNLDLSQQDLLMSDILILRITNYKVKNALEILNYILPKRRDKDLTTIIMSDLPYRYLMTQLDYISFEINYLVELHI